METAPEWWEDGAQDLASAHDSRRVPQHFAARKVAWAHEQMAAALLTTCMLLCASFVLHSHFHLALE